MRPLDFTDLIMVDDIIPSDFSPFRTIEYEHYLRFFNSALLSLEGWHAWIGNQSFDELLENFPIDFDLKSRIVRFRTHANMTARLAYVTFLGNAIRLMPFFESRGIPFILQLYPGGGFEIDRPETDEKLRRVLCSELCRRVIVTQHITERYIVDKIGVDPAKIEHIFGGVFESRTPFGFDRDKVFYPRDKDTIDLCFVAHKYGGNITSKGYDQFVAIAVELAGAFEHVRFHVVGDYLPEDVPMGEFTSRFTFYGRRSSAFLADLHKSMDAIISINRPFDLTPGSFDGFPTGACIEAGFHGVLNCINDPLGLNPCFSDGGDIILLNLDHLRSAARLRDLIRNPIELYRIAEQGCRKFHEVFDTNRQLWARARVIAAELSRHEGLIMRPAPDPSALDAGLFERALVPYRERIAALEGAVNQVSPGITSVSEINAAAQHEIETLRAQSAAFADQLHRIRSSTSWRLTAPLRRLLEPYPGLGRLGRRTLKLIWWTLSLQLASRYRARSRMLRDVTGPYPVQAQLSAPAIEQSAEPRAILTQAVDPDETAEGEPATPGNANRPAGSGHRLSLLPDHTAKIERTLSLHADRLDRSDALAVELLREIRWDQTRTDFALGAIEGMLEEVERFQAERLLADYQAVFDQSEPLVSICVATADQAELLSERCIPSLLAQTYRNLQIIVVGDHCTDDTEDRLAQFGDDRITFMNLPERGPYPRPGHDRWCVIGSNAMNAALANCQGHFITHLEDDDCYTTDRIERLVQVCLEQKAEFCWHPFWAQLDTGKWEVIGDGRFSANQLTPGAVFYHRYFSRFKWDPSAYRLNESGDWNRLRKIKMLRPKVHFLAEPLLQHHCERQQTRATVEGERFLD
jgi:hypothetical protein